MTERQRTLIKVVQAGAGVDQVVGAAYRGLMLLSDASALSRMAEASVEIALKVQFAKSHYLIFVKTECPLARETALTFTRSLAGDVGRVLQGAERVEAARVLTGWRRVLEEGADAALQIDRAEDLAARAARRGQASLERLAARTSSEHFIDVASGIDLAITRTLMDPTSSPQQRALELFLRAVPRSDIAAWDTLLGRIAGFNRLIENADELRVLSEVLSQKEFLTLLRPEANIIKGQALETWFWRSPAWKSREALLDDSAWRRAQALGGATRGWQPLVLTEPLLTMGGMGLRGGLEIYDGVVLVAREYRPGLGVVEAYLDAVVQIKAERNITALLQVARDMRREAELGGLTELRTRDGSLVVRLLQAPDAAEPFRLIVAPTLPAGHLAQVPRGVLVAGIPTLMDAYQLDDFAYLLLRGAIAR